MDKALKLIMVLAENEEASSRAQLAARLGISSSTCYRILQTLVAHDWLRCTAAGRHVFSTGLLPLQQALFDYQRLFEHLRGPLEAAVTDTGLTAKISIKQGARAVTVYRVESQRGLAPSSKVGASFPLAFGSSGACLLAGLDDDDIAALFCESPPEVWRLQGEKDVWKRIESVRRNGVCYDPGQFQPSVHGVSAPIEGADGDVLAVVSLVGWLEDFQGPEQARLMGKIKSCAAECSGCLSLPRAA